MKMQSIILILLHDTNDISLSRARDPWHPALRFADKSRRLSVAFVNTTGSDVRVEELYFETGTLKARTGSLRSDPVDVGLLLYAREARCSFPMFSSPSGLAGAAGGGWELC